MSRLVTINIPSDYCNSCQFFKTWMPDPESCTGFGGFRKYHCELFKKRLSPNHNITHRKRYDSFESDEKKAFILDECKNKYK